MVGGRGQRVNGLVKDKRPVGRPPKEKRKKGKQKLKKKVRMWLNIASYMCILQDIYVLHIFSKSLKTKLWTVCMVYGSLFGPLPLLSPNTCHMCFR